MTNKVLHYKDIKDKLLEAVDLIANPVVQTLSPKGGNVLFSHQGTTVSNDGITIARSINPIDKFTSSIVNTIREAAVRTNTEAGDGTTTSILFASTLIRKGMELRDNGMNSQDLAKYIKSIPNRIIPQLEALRVTDITPEVRFNIAKISASGDEEIAKNVVEIVDVAGTEGMVFIDPNNKLTDTIIKDIGYIIDTGMYSPEFRNNGFLHQVEDVPVFVTDKNLYYKEEVEALIKSALKVGSKNLTIFARDFSGQAIEYFKANHGTGKYNLLLVKVADNDTLEDIAVYTSAKVCRDASGSIVNKLVDDFFGHADKIISEPKRTLISSNTEENEALQTLCTTLRDTIETSVEEEVDTLKKRLASLTNGMVTLKVGGATEMEIKERIYRYEDAVNALRATIKDGYLPGAGVAMWEAWTKDNQNTIADEELVQALCYASSNQIGINCGKTVEEVKEYMDTSDLGYGYDAVSDSIVDVVEAGIIDPFTATKLAVENACAVASNLLSVNYYIIEDEDKNNNK